MKAYKLEILVYDEEDCGEGDIKTMVENADLGNHVFPIIISCKGADIGEFDDDHILSQEDTFQEGIKKYFK